MKYMTAELLARLQSADEAIVDAADEEWSRRCEAYRTHLAAIQADLSYGVKAMLRHQLHDAKVLTVAVDEENCFSVFLDLGQTEDPRDKNLELRYHLTAAPGCSTPGYDFTYHQELSGYGQMYKRWLYDEVDVIETGKAFVHNILLSGGVELRLIFSKLFCARLNYLVPPSVEPARKLA